MLHVALAPVATLALLGPTTPGNPFAPLSLQPSGVIIPMTPHPIDFDGDGDLDLLVGNGFLQIQPPTIALLENDGRGNFRPTAFPLISPSAGFTIPRGTFVIDTALDGAPDVLVVFSDGHLALFPNDPVLGFLAEQTHGPVVGTGGGLSSIAPTALAQGDLDGDGREEAVIALTQVTLFSPPLGLGIAIVRFDATGAIAGVTSTSFGTGEIGAMELVDLDGDRHLDLVCLDANGFLVVSRGMGTGGFHGPVHVALPVASTLPDHLACGDVDGDSDLDVVVGFADRTELVLFEQTGSLTFSARHLPLTTTRGGLNHLALVDMDGDAHLDLVTVEVVGPQMSGFAAVYRGRGDGSFSLYGTQEAGMMAVASGFSLRLRVIADFDGNATPDLLLSQARTQSGVAATLGLFGSRFDRPYEIRHESTGAPGSHGEPQLNAIGAAVRGNQHFALRVSQGPPFAPLLILSSPWSQEAFVDPIVRMLVVPVAFEPGILDANGAYHFPVPIPNDLALHGEWGYAQAWIGDPGAPNTLGVAASRRLAVRVGTRF